MKKIKSILTLIMILAPLAMSAQQRANVKVTLKDSLSKEPIAFATVSLTKPGAANPVSYALTTTTGEATLDKVAFGEYQFRAELMGYKTVTKTIKVEKRTMDLGTISLEEDTIALEAAKVSAVGNPVVVKQDTIEYNASSFKVSENAVLKDLLAKLPGVEIDKEGNISANGKTINKITVNGKTFFLDDPNIASENLPAKIIEKVKVVDKKSDQSAFTGIEDDDKETIIDVSTYKGKYDGWFGNVNAAGGLDLPSAAEKEAGVTADPRFSGRGMLGQFSDNWNTFLVANGNNTNTGGFGMRGGGGMGGFGGSNGITTTWLTAANVGYNGVENLELTTSAQYGGSNTLRTSESTRTDFYKDQSDKYSESESESTSESESIEFGADVRYTPQKTRVTFRPTFTFNNQQSNSSSTSNTWDDAGALNDSKSFNFSLGNTMTARGNLMVGQQLGKAGRTVSINMNYNISDSDTDAKSYSDTRYFNNSARDEHLDQYSYTKRESRTFGGNLQYTEPLMNNLFLSGSYSFNYNGSDSHKTTFDYGGGDAGHKYSASTADKNLYDKENEFYSSIVEQKFIRQSAGLSLQYQKDRNFVQIGGEIQPTLNENYTKSYGQESHVGQGEWLYNWAPQIRARYNINDNSNINVSYNGRSSQPSASNLQTILDKSNPTSRSTGNAYLTPTFTHNASLRYFINNRQSFSSFNASINGSYTTNGIVNASWTDRATGIRFSVPVNTKKPSSNYRGNIMFNTPIARSNFSISSNTSGSVGYSTSYQLRAGEQRGALDPETFNYAEFMSEFWGNTSGDRFYSGKSGFDESATTNYSVSENIRLRYNGDIFSGSLGANFRYNSALYSLKPEQNTSTWNNSINADALFSIASIGLELGGDAQYRYYRGYAAGFGDKPEMIINLNANKIFGSLSLGLKVNDLLNQTQSISRSLSENFMQDSRSNVLGRYFLVSLTYNFGKLAGQRRGGMGMGPMGGGPGMGMGRMGGGMRH